MTLVIKNPSADLGDMKCGINPWVRKIPEGWHGNLFQYSCLENPMDRGAWQATVHMVAESDMTEAT